jgi:aldose sugar dehydrogenase
MRYAALILAVVLSGSALAQSRPAPVVATSQAGPLSVETVASGLENPWGLAFLPDGRMLVTERPGRLRIVSQAGVLSTPIANVPRVVARGQGGLLDVALDPDFAANRLVYLSYSEPREDGRNSTSVLRGRLSDSGTTLENTSVIFRQNPAANSNLHFGSRLIFARDGALFITTGDRYGLKDEAQNPASHLGKIIRIRPDGSVPVDNPGKPGWAKEVWSIGHRNVQGAALHPVTGQLWTIEHGARGGDEVNTPRAGLNYGWPVITYGIDYSGLKIGEGRTKPGMEQPVFYWDPSIAPSGAAFYTGEAFPAWKGSLFTGALAGQMLVRLSLDGEKVTGEERLLTNLQERIRDVRQGPDGFLYLLTDASNGRVLRVRPGR